MRSTEKINKLIENLDLGVDTHPETDRAILNELLEVRKKSKKMHSAFAPPDIRRQITKSPIAKLAAAAVMVIAVTLGVSLVRGPDMADVAWGDVVTHMGEVDHVHVYWLLRRGDVLSSASEVWCDRGQIVYCGNDGDMIYDDGRTSLFFNNRGMLVARSRSRRGYGTVHREWMRDGWFSRMNGQFSEQVPTSVGDDFLIYAFDASLPEDHWFQRAFITVGKNSLLPIQVKALHGDGDYDLIIYDYEEPRKPPEFFEPPAIAPPNGMGEVMLDGEEVVIDIENAPGLKHAIVRLYAKYDGPADQFPLDYIRSDGDSQSFYRSISEKMRKTYEKAGGPIFRCDLTFVTDEGYPSGTHDLLVLRLDEARQCGVGAADGGWPDGKYRNVRFSPWLKPTDTEDTYIVEIRCWIKTKTD